VALEQHFLPLLWIHDVHEVEISCDAFAEDAIEMIGKELEKVQLTDCRGYWVK
jgi:hypothetical protein